MTIKINQRNLTVTFLILIIYGLAIPGFLNTSLIGWWMYSCTVTTITAFIAVVILVSVVAGIIEGSIKAFSPFEIKLSKSKAERQLIKLKKELERAHIMKEGCQEDEDTHGSNHWNKQIINLEVEVAKLKSKIPAKKGGY